MRHNNLANRAAENVAKGRIKFGKRPKVLTEVPRDSNLRTRTLGSSTSQADAVTLLPLEAIVTRASVNLSPEIAKGIHAQVEGCVQSLSTAAGIPKKGLLSGRELDEKQ